MSFSIKHVYFTTPPSFCNRLRVIYDSSYIQPQKSRVKTNLRLPTSTDVYYKDEKCFSGGWARLTRIVVDLGRV